MTAETWYKLSNLLDLLKDAETKQSHLVINPPLIKELITALTDVESSFCGETNQRTWKYTWEEVIEWFIDNREKFLLFYNEMEDSICIYGYTKNVKELYLMMLESTRFEPFYNDYDLNINWDSAVFSTLQIDTNKQFGIMEDFYLQNGLLNGEYREADDIWNYL